MYYFRWFLFFIWMVFAASAGLFLAIFRWGDLRLNRIYSQIFSRGALRLLRIRLEVENEEILAASQPCIYVGNHQSSLDMATFGKIFPDRTLVIGKKELIWVPLFGLFFKAGNNVMIDRKKRVRAIAGLTEAVEAIQKLKASIWIFPEGTRNHTADPMLPFKKGAFYMAIEAKVPIVPVVCCSLKPIVNEERKTMSGGKVRIKVLPPVSTQGLSEAEIPALMEKVRGEMIEAFLGLSASSVENR